nr:protein TolQ [Gammaproteobacteria bacterium]
MTTDLSLITLVANASVLVQIVMGILLVASLASWTMIFRKRGQLGAARRAADDFEDRFWSGKDLLSLYNKITSRRHSPAGMERIFEAGFKEFARLRKQANIDPA